jgi:hypothetical protein
LKTKILASNTIMLKRRSVLSSSRNTPSYNSYLTRFPWQELLPTVQYSTIAWIKGDMNFGSINERNPTFDMPGADRFETRSITSFRKGPFACRLRFQLLTSLPYARAHVLSATGSDLFPNLPVEREASPETPLSSPKALLNHV